MKCGTRQGQRQNAVKCFQGRYGGYPHIGVCERECGQRGQSLRRTVKYGAQKRRNCKKCGSK